MGHEGLRSWRCIRAIRCVGIWSPAPGRDLFFFKQKTAYELRISDWSSDVCSSDLEDHRHVSLANVAHMLIGDAALSIDDEAFRHARRTHGDLHLAPRIQADAGIGIAVSLEEGVDVGPGIADGDGVDLHPRLLERQHLRRLRRAGARKSVVQGKGVSVRVDLVWGSS